MLLTFSVKLPDGTIRDILVLLDTGARIHLVRRGLLDPPLLHTTAQLVRLKVASGTPMIGGREEASESFQFRRSHAPHVASSATSVGYSDVWYQEDISSYDLILGCPFMVNNSMGDFSSVETATQSLPPHLLADTPPCWVTSCYTIKSQRLQEVKDHVNCPTPTVDAFASAAYRGALDIVTLVDYTFPPHTKLFLRENGKPLCLTPWKGGTRAILVDGSPDAMPCEL